MLWYNHTFFANFMCLLIGSVSQVSNVPHRPIVDSRVKNQSISHNMQCCFALNSFGVI